MSEERPLNPDDERAIAKVRRLMTIASVTTFLAVAAVLGVIGYRVFNGGGSTLAITPFEKELSLPAGAKILSVTINEGQLAVTLEINSETSVWFYDLKTLRPLGRISLKVE